MTKLTRNGRFHIITLIGIVLILITLFVGLAIMDGSLTGGLEAADTLVINGQYSVDDGNTYLPYSVPGDIDYMKLQHLIIKGHTDVTLDDDDEVYLYGYAVDVDMYVNGELVYTSDRASDSTWGHTEDLVLTPDDEIVLEYTQRENTIFASDIRSSLKRLYIGNDLQVFKAVFSSVWYKLLMIVLILMLGVAMLLSAIGFRHDSIERMAGMIACGMALICGACTCFNNPEYLPLITTDYVRIDFADSIIQMLTVIFLSIYLTRYMEKEIYVGFARAAISLLLLFTFAVAVIRLFGLLPGQVIGVLALGPGIVLVFMYFFLIVKSYIDNNDRQHIRGITLTIIVLIICSFMELVNYLLTSNFVITYFEIGLIVFGIGQYEILQSENAEHRMAAERARELENELMQSQVNIMMSQIQPHFMYNALGTIRALCTRNPEEARKAMDYFTKFLRANMDSINQKECIPFSKELEHVESYLYIEHLRFGDLLKVNYEIECKDFGIPAMTVQTLAENAVKHGLLARESGGTLTIRSRETANCYEVQIEDNGVGFDSNQKLDDSRSHVGIENSRQRIMRMCGGNLSIGSKIGVGTVVTISIPKVREA